MQLSVTPPSIEHRKVPGSDEIKEKLAVVEFVGSSGPSVVVGDGGVMSGPVASTTQV